MASRLYLKPPEASDVAGPLEADGLQPLLQAGFDGAQPAAAPADDGHLLCHAALHHRVSAWGQRRTAGLSDQGCNCAKLLPGCTREVPREEAPQKFVWDYKATVVPHQVWTWPVLDFALLWCCLWMP